MYTCSTEVRVVLDAGHGSRYGTNLDSTRGRTKLSGTKRGVGRPRKGVEAGLNPLNALDREERRELFLETATRLFEKKGYVSTSVDDIAGELGFSKAIFYYYFDSKGDLLNEIHDRGMDLVNSMLDRLEKEVPHDETRLEAAIAGYIECVLGYRALVTIVSGDTKYTPKIRLQRRDVTARFQRLIEEEMAAGRVRFDLDARFTASSILGMCNSLAQWYQPEGKIKLEDAKQSITELVARGFIPRPDLPNPDEALG